MTSGEELISREQSVTRESTGCLKELYGTWKADGGDPLDWKSEKKSY